MNEEKRSGREIAVEGKVYRWFDNFWYHYKWITIGVLAALVILIVCIAQSCSKEKEDVLVVYAGADYLSTSQVQQLSDTISYLLPHDYDKNGKKLALMNMYQILSEEQIRDITAQTDVDGKPRVVDRSRNSNLYSSYTNYLQTGESSVFLLDPWLYEELKRADRLRPLGEVCGQIPQGAMDDYGVRLGDTEIYEKYDVLKLLDEDTVICLMKPHLLGRSSDEKAYQFEVDVFLTLVTFRNEEN